MQILFRFFDVQKTKLSGKQKRPSACSIPSVTNASQITQLEKVKPTCEENEERCKAHPVPISNSTGRASTAATQFVQTTTVTQFTRKSREEMAAIKIQSVFRGYLVWIRSCNLISIISKNENILATFPFFHRGSTSISLHLVNGKALKRFL